MEKKEEIKDYIVKGKLDIEKVIDKYYSYIYMIVKNSVSSMISDEDIEEIISDVFIAIWKNASTISGDIPIKAYMVGSAKNIIKNKYRAMQNCIEISEYEETLVDSTDLERLVEDNEKNRIILSSLKDSKEDEYKIL